MAYAKSIWLEFGMTIAQKLTALTNLECMYDELVDYTDLILHGSIYYTFAECTAKYFTTSNDGDGSTLITKYLDGYTAQQIIDAGIPSGSICIWKGSIASIPSGFVLCDGMNSTPDLRSAAIVGAGSNYSRGSSGGNNIVTCIGTIDFAAYTLQIADIPDHYHALVEYGPNAGGRPASAAGSYSLVVGITSASANTASTGGGQAHEHTSSFTGDEQEKMPPYKAVCFIMKT
jgi:hypothetical protein